MQMEASVLDLKTSGRVEKIEFKLDDNLGPLSENCDYLLECFW